MQRSASLLSAPQIPRPSRFSPNRAHENWPDTLAERKKRFAVLGIGVLANHAMMYSFDFVLYPFVLLKLGALNGGFLMTVLSFVLGYACLLFYDWSKTDWLGIEALKSLREISPDTYFGRLTARILTKSEPVILLFLSLKFDPFIATAYMRRGNNQFNGLTRRDWKLFLASLLIGNVYWTLAIFAGFSLVAFLFGALGHLY